MIAFNVVVFPAPLRPRSVTTSPWCTLNSTPCRMCDSPYHAWRSRTDSRTLPALASGMAGPQVSLHDIWIPRHARIVAFGQDLAARQDRDRVRQGRDNAQIV